MVVDHDLRPRRRAGGAEDAGDVVGRIALGQARGGDAARHGPEEIVLRIGAGRIGAVAAEAHERLAGQQRIAVELLVHQREHGADRHREIGDQRGVELDVERRDHRAEPPDAEPDQKLLEVLVGQQQHPAALADALVA